MRVRDIMRKDFIWFNSGDSFAHVLSRMAQNEISSAPVFHEGGFAGVISASEMVRYFGKKDYASLWKKNKSTPIDKMKGTRALDFAKKTRILTPDDKLEDALSIIAATQGCVPVVENKKLVGIVRASDVIKFFLTEVAKDENKCISDVPSSKMENCVRGEEAESLDTSIDEFLKLVKAEPDLRLVIKDFPVLGPNSVEAAEIATAMRNQAKGDKYWQYHTKLMQTRGQIGKAQALAVAKELGADMDKLAKDAASPETRASLQEVMMIADKLQLTGTPTFVLADEVIVGAVGHDELRNKIGNLRKCGKTACG